MAISEQQLSTWSHQGSKVQSQSTYETVRGVLNDPTSPYYPKSFRIFLQGSYGNDTNIYADSDIDIGICLTSSFYDDVSALNVDENAQYQRDKTPGTYTFNQFKAEVLAWLKLKFGAGVRAGKKAIFIPGNGSRRDTDVLVCVEHRAYWSYVSAANNRYHEGICFWMSDGTKIINYPKQHMDNCTAKNQSSAGRFKPNIRVLKNMRNAMIDKGILSDGKAPSYYLEGMLWNVPADRYVNSFQSTLLNYMGGLDQCNSTQLVCANERYYLLRDGSHVCWNTADYTTFRAAARRLWDMS